MRITPSHLFASTIRRAFTLIELMVVMGIVVLIIAVSLPAIKAMTKGNDTGQAAAMLSSLISHARSIAISQGRMAAVVLYEEGAGLSPPQPANRTSALFLVEDRTNTTAVPAGFIRFYPLPDSTVQHLPVGAKIASFNTDTSGNTRLFADSSVLAANTNKVRVVVFDNGGQLVLSGGIAIDTNPGRMTTNFNSSLDTTYGVPAWQVILKDTLLVDINTVPTATQIPLSASSPGFVIYSNEEFNNANPTGTPIDTQNQWLIQHAKVLVINAYTGTVIQ